MSEKKLIRLYVSTDEATRRRGRIWYPSMHEHLSILAREYERPLEQVAAVLAITSVDAQLSTNLRWTVEILQGKRTAGRYPANQTPKVLAALSADDPGQHVTGPKCQAFYRAVMGDPDALVLDRWMFMPVVGRQKRSIGVRLRAQVEEAYRNAAAFCEEQVRDFQATVWLALRESTPDSRGRIPRLVDITDISGS